METTDSLISELTTFGLSAGVLAGLGILVYFVHRRLLAFYSDKPGQQHYRQLIMVCIWIAIAILAIILMPVSDLTQGQLLSFLGILLSATIALSSTTLVGNAMAGLMLKSLRNIRPGDYIFVGDHFGRVSNMDLLHVEIQTEDRDLTALPNLYLVTNPVRVLRSSGTILHVAVSLGYEIPRQRIEAAAFEILGREAAGRRSHRSRKTFRADIVTQRLFRQLPGVRNADPDRAPDRHAQEAACGGTRRTACDRHRDRLAYLYEYPGP